MRRSHLPACCDSITRDDNAQAPTTSICALAGDFLPAGACGHPGGVWAAGPPPPMHANPFPAVLQRLRAAPGMEPTALQQRMLCAAAGAGAGGAPEHRGAAPRGGCCCARQRGPGTRLQPQAVLSPGGRALLKHMLPGTCAWLGQRCLVWQHVGQQPLAAGLPAQGSSRQA